MTIVLDQNGNPVEAGNVAGELISLRSENAKLREELAAAHRAGMLAAADIAESKGKEFSKPDYKATYILCAAAIREAAKK